ncbi:MAG: type II toxin-antitoxin system HicB family antitoxin [Candidatus Jacksonbacteria bacterium]|nr:type II toxin-antitoxin system HicB family antitoxin [Candidatus Jacksonbacteria bacterium]
MKFFTFKIIIEPEENPEDGYYAYSPELPGCYSNGATIEETRVNMRDALETHLEVFIDRNKLSSLQFKYREKPVYTELFTLAVPA